MNGRLKIYGKAVLLSQYGRMISVILIFAIITAFSNNLFIAEKYLLDLFDFGSFSNTLGENTARIVFTVIFSAVISLLSVTAMMPLRFGKEIWFFENAKKNRLKVSKIFSAYRSGIFFKSIRFSFVLFFNKLMWSFVFFIPSICIAAYLFFSLKNGISKSLLAVAFFGLVVTLFVGTFFFFVFCQRYALSYVLYNENPNSKISGSVKLSAKIMDNKCFELARLKLSFIPWFMLCVFIFPVFYVYPYYKITVAVKQSNILCTAIDEI